VKSLSAAVILSLIAVTAAYAQPMMGSGAEPTPAQRRTDYCNSLATQSRVKSDQRKAFVKSCMSKVDACVAAADDKKLKGMDYIKSVGDCVKK